MTETSSEVPGQDRGDSWELRLWSLNEYARREAERGTPVNPHLLAQARAGRPLGMHTSPFPPNPAGVEDSDLLWEQERDRYIRHNSQRLAPQTSRKMTRRQKLVWFAYAPFTAVSLSLAPWTSSESTFLKLTISTAIALNALAAGKVLADLWSDNFNPEAIR